MIICYMLYRYDYMLYDYMIVICYINMLYDYMLYVI